MEVTAIKTPVTPQELESALTDGINCYLTIRTIHVIMAQWKLETGGGEFCWNYNIGNVKTKPKATSNLIEDWTFRRCFEYVSPAAVSIMKSPRSPESLTSLITIEHGAKDTPKGKVKIWVDPPHPGCCFMAFDSLAEGAESHVRTLQKRFALAWDAIEDPEKFSKALAKHDYYTAPEPAYTAVMVQNYNGFHDPWMLKYAGYSTVKAFQKSNDLTQDGRIGPITRAALRRVAEQ